MFAWVWQKVNLYQSFMMWFLCIKIYKVNWYFTYKGILFKKKNRVMAFTYNNNKIFSDLQN